MGNIAISIIGDSFTEYRQHDGVLDNTCECGFRALGTVALCGGGTYVRTGSRSVFTPPYSHIGQHIKMILFLRSAKFC